MIPEYEKEIDHAGISLLFTAVRAVFERRRHATPAFEQAGNDSALKALDKINGFAPR